MSRARARKRSTQRGAYRLAAGRDYRRSEILSVNLSKRQLRKARRLGFKVRRTTRLRNVRLAVNHLTVPSDLDPVSAQELLRNELPGARAELNHIYRLSGAREERKADSGAGCVGDNCAWYSNAVAWSQNATACADGIRIGIVDTGVDRSHPLIAKRRIQSKSFRDNGKPAASTDHGTAIVALLTGGTGENGTGLVPNARLYVGDIFHADEDGVAVASTVSLLKALDWMRGRRVDIINMSLSGPPDDLLRDAVEKLAADGIVLVAAAGNDGPKAPPRYPAAYPDVVAVTAVDRDLQAYRRANRGDYIDISAPGVGIRLVAKGELVRHRSGTSYATPFVTAALAIMPRAHLGMYRAEQLVNQFNVKDLGPEGRDPIFGRGLVLVPKRTCAHTRVVN